MSLTSPEHEPIRHPVDAELPARIHSAVLHLLRRLAREDRALGESPARLSALSVLVFGGPRTFAALARIEGVRAPTMTRLVAGMEADGLVSRQPDPTDGRAMLVSATDRGRALLLEGRQRRIAAMTQLLDRLAPDERNLLAEAARLIEERLLAES
jgi:DNA-binding MarR family transcriptional regulator